MYEETDSLTFWQIVKQEFESGESHYLWYGSGTFRAYHIREGNSRKLKKLKRRFLWETNKFLYFWELLTYLGFSCYAPLFSMIDPVVKSRELRMKFIDWNISRIKARL